MPSFDYTRVLVSDFSACYRFYRDVIGLTPGFGTDTDSYADFTTGQTGISLFDANEMAEAVGTLDLPQSAPARDRMCLVFGVEDVDALWETAPAAHRAVPPTDHPDWGIRTAHFRDPDGNLVEVNQSLG